MKKLNLSKKIESNEIYNCLINSYNKISTDWIYHQWNWLNQNYDAFNDLIKYLISIALIRDTLKFYQTLGRLYDYDTYYSYDSLQIDKFSISNLSKEFNLPKETMRRKLLELEKSKVIKRKDKKIFFDRSAFNLVKPNNQIQITSKYLSKISKLLFQEKKIDKIISEKEINEKIKKNFSKIWLWYYEFQITLMINWKTFFDDINSFYIWGTLSLNQIYNENNKNIKPEIENLVFDQYLEKVLNNSGSGLNVMSISEMTKIPRATVIRKIKYLEDEKLVKSNSKKQYYLSDFTPFKITPTIKDNFKLKSEFIAKVINTIIV
ncbi:hypothetical protein [Candidatus Pelagibacter sp. HIMB1321]|uniref:hypothetical protein n=1 Tax=Candidatus Pelagibacter sp. HIMB1321 TaxID=1388755 RepID=UPI000A081BA0|nr:hypothetical protein [Candidatus Pelagibacter sp. HIMB1321]SMF77024.1 hypothetical protein SAMN02744631_0771 [Candidatus Pelagibacter sp. HIMB1321]